MERYREEGTMPFRELFHNTAPWEAIYVSAKEEIIVPPDYKVIAIWHADVGKTHMYIVPPNYPFGGKLVTPSED